MKKIISIVLIIAITFSLFGCAEEVVNKVGVAPHDFDEGEEYVLSVLGMNSNTLIVDFNAPEWAKYVRLEVRALQDGELTVLNTMAQPLDGVRNGAVTVELEANSVINHSIYNDGGRGSVSTNEIIIDGAEAGLGWTHTFLTEFQEIERNQEIPIAIIAYDVFNDSKVTTEAPQLKDFEDLTMFEGTALVQIVTIKFSDEEL